jgi:hypothetical protein
MESTIRNDGSNELIVSSLQLLEKMSQAGTGKTYDQILNWYRNEQVASSQMVSLREADINALEYYIEQTIESLASLACLPPEELEERRREVNEKKDNLNHARAIQRVCIHLFDTKAAIVNTEPELPS